MLTGVGTTINNVSQLFLEAIYMHEKENAKLTPTAQYQTTICILTDSMCWHFFLLNLSTKPIMINEYTNLNGEKKEVIVKKVVDLLCSYIPEKCT